MLDRKYTHSPANGIRYAAIRCFTKEPHRGDNYFTLFAILAFQRKKQVIRNPYMYKNRQHPTEVECRLFCCPILLGRCRFCSFLRLLSYRHTPKALFFALLLNSRRKSERFHFGTLLLNFLRKFNHFRTSLPASPTSPDILSGKSHIPSEMPGKKRNNPEIQTPGRRS